MQFKIDTKDTFTVIIPQNEKISAKMAGEIPKKCHDLKQSGSKNFIIDLGHCQEMDKEIINDLVSLHEQIYSNGQSLVFTGLSNAIMAGLKRDETDLLLNIAPRMDEAIDIISMEILERDLFGEE
jgi:anti-anti-sigma regulatory factor